MEKEELVYIRERILDMTQDELAETLHVSKRTVQYWEAGRFKMPLEKEKKIYDLTKSHEYVSEDYAKQKRNLKSEIEEDNLSRLIEVVISQQSVIESQHKTINNLVDMHFKEEKPGQKRGTDPQKKDKS